MNNMILSYTGFMSTARDSNRLTQLEWIHNGLETYKTKGKLPLPDDSVPIYASGTIIGYQGNGGETVLNKIGYQKGGKDPLDDKYYTYYTDKKQQNIELLGFLENDQTANKETVFRHPEFIPGSIIQGYITKQRIKDSETSSEGRIFLVLPKIYTTDYTERTITTFGKKLGILLDTSNNPIQENTTLKTSGLDIVTTTGSYKSVFSSLNTATSSGIIIGTGIILSQSNPTASCKRILESGLGNTSGTYSINPSGISFQVYCDMTTDGGGWTLAFRLNTKDNNTRRYDDTFWGTGGFIGDLITNQEDYLGQAVDIKAFNKILLSFEGLENIKAEYLYQNNIKSLRENYNQSLSNTNQLWDRIYTNNIISSNFFGQGLSFNVIGNGDDAFRIWYNKVTRDICNQGGGIGTKGDAYAWWIEAGFTSIDTGCQENTQRTYLGTNWGGGHDVINNPILEAQLSPASIYNTNYVKVYIK